MKTCYPEPCTSEYSNEWRENEKKSLFSRCCGERMQKIIRYSVFTCKICGSVKKYESDYSSACKTCNKHIYFNYD